MVPPDAYKLGRGNVAWRPTQVYAVNTPVGLKTCIELPAHISSMDVPVLAYAAGAVPETLGGAGVLFSPKDLEFAAEMLGTLVYDRPVRDQVIAGQRRRLRDFSTARIESRLKDVLAGLGA